MKHTLLWLAGMSLLAMACRLADGSGLGAVTPTAQRLVLTPTTAVGEPARTASPTTAANTPPPIPSTTTSPDVIETAASSTPRPTSPATSLPITPTPCPVRVEWPEYIVQAGDTLFQIAQRAGSTVDELVAANCFSDGDHIFVGQLLRVPPTMNDPAVFPTRISEGTDLVTYPGDQCVSPPFTIVPGVSAGERWRVSTKLEVLTVYDGPYSNNPTGLLQRGEHFWVQEGPACFSQNFGSNQQFLRRWRIESEERPLGGWINERDVFTELITVEARPIVHRFEASPQLINSGDPITIAWEVEGANDVGIYAYHNLYRFASGPVGDPPQLPPSGTLTVTAPLSLTSIQFSIGFGPEEPDHWAQVTIQCTERFFAEVPDIAACPMGPATRIQAAYQPFERGFMLWWQEEHWALVWVLHPDQPSGRVFTDNWAGEEISFAETPPPGLFQPVRGFGKVWVEDEAVRQRLGWATAEEQVYTMEIQKAQTSYASFHYVLTLPDGQPISAGRSMGSHVTWAFTTRR